MLTLFFILHSYLQNALFKRPFELYVFCVRPYYLIWIVSGNLLIKDSCHCVFCHLIKLLEEVKENCICVLTWFTQKFMSTIFLFVKSSLLYAFQFSPSLVVLTLFEFLEKLIWLPHIVRISRKAKKLLLNFCYFSIHFSFAEKPVLFVFFWEKWNLIENKVLKVSSLFI